MGAPARVVITGAPGGGKSSLLAELQDRGFQTVPEVARAILRRPDGMQLREGDPHGFAKAMLEAERVSFEDSRPSARPTIFDRGFPDIAGFLRIEELEIPPDLESACQTIRYDGPIFRAPAWRAIYQQDAQRIQSWQEAVTSDQAVCHAWQDYGYDVIDLPLCLIKERADFVVEHLKGG